MASRDGAPDLSLTGRAEVPTRSVVGEEATASPGSGRGERNPRSANMRANRRRDTRPELAIRSGLHRMGLRYRVDHRLGAGRSAPRPDIAFTRARVAVFVDGCFWHGCPEHGGTPSVNVGYWGPKLERNKERDRANEAELAAAGWLVLRVWEHEDPGHAISRIAETVRERLGELNHPEADRAGP